MFPSIITSFPRPNPTDRLNNPSHSALENLQSSAIGQIQAVIGLSTSSALGSLMYDVRSPSSDGGGHVQSAVKGGTGQTTFTKGNLLVATNASTLSKLAIGLDGQALVADSSVAAGLKWGTAGATKILASVLSSLVAENTALETSIFSTTIPGSTLGANSAVRATVNVLNWGFGSPASSIMVRGIYGGNRVSSVMFTDGALAPANNAGLKGKIEFTLFGNGTTSAQYGDTFVSAFKNFVNLSSVIGLSAMDGGTASVNSSANQTFGITVKYSDVSSQGYIRVGGVIVEKII